MPTLTEVRRQSAFDDAAEPAPLTLGVVCGRTVAIPGVEATDDRSRETRSTNWARAVGGGPGVHAGRSQGFDDDQDAPSRQRPDDACAAHRVGGSSVRYADDAAFRSGRSRNVLACGESRTARVAIRPICRRAGQSRNCSTFLNGVRTHRDSGEPSRIGGRLGRKSRSRTRGFGVRPAHHVSWAGCASRRSACTSPRGAAQAGAQRHGSASRLVGEVLGAQAVYPRRHVEIDVVATYAIGDERFGGILQGKLKTSAVSSFRIDVGRAGIAQW